MMKSAVPGSATSRAKQRLLVTPWSSVSGRWHLAAVATLGLIFAGLALMAWRVSGHETVPVGTEADRIYVGDGFYDPEKSPEVGAYRWTQPLAYLELPGWGPGNLHVKISGVGAGNAAGEALLSIAGTPVNHITIKPGERWSVEAWGISGTSNPTVTIEGPRLDAPGDARSLSHLVTSLELFSPDARSRALLNLALLALTGLLLYALLLYWFGNPAFALAAAASVPALFGPLAAFRDAWAGAVAWTAPIILGVLLGLTLFRPSWRRSVARGRRPVILATIALTSTLLLLTQGFLNAFDSDRMYQMAAGLAEYGLPTRYPGHATWTKYGFGESLISVPFYLLGKLAALSGGDAEQIERFAVSMTNLPVTALTCLLLYLGSRRFASSGVAVMVAATYLLSTMALNYARTYFSEPAGAALLLLATLLILPGAQNAAPTRKHLLAAGACLGAMILFKPAFLCYWPVAILAVAWQAAREPVAGSYPSKIAWIRHIVSKLAYLGAGLIAAGAIQLGYNYLRYHDVANGLLRTGYEREPGFSTPLQEGLFGLLLSPGKSLLLYAPVVLLAPVGLWLMYRKHGTEGKLIALIIVAQALVGLGFNARWWAWTGNFAWGPRLILPVLPLVVLPLAAIGAFALERRPELKPGSGQLRSWRTALIAAWVCLAVAGTAISIAGAMVDFQIYYRQYGLLLAGDPGEEVTIYDPGHSPILEETGYLFSGLTAAIHRPALADLGLPHEWDTALPAILVTTACLAAWAVAPRPPKPT
ncbi:MAG TPA: hypothetical protein VM409_05865 [Chloroflexia bacterium]|nr:hypothetical protein [Chloroflexia bacterium]